MTLLVSSGQSGTVLEYNATTGAFIKEAASGGALQHPVGVVIGLDGNLLVVDIQTNQVKRYNRTTGAFIDVFAFEGTVPALKVNTSTRIKKGETVEIVPEHRRGRGQPRAISLDDVVLERGAGGNRRMTRRESLRKLGEMWATREEVAGFFGIHRGTLYNFFKRCPEALVIYEDAKLSGNVSQRRRNVRLAETSAAMSIFLSKNQLGMRDDFAVSGKVDHEHTMLHRLLQELGDGTHGKVIQHDETER